jgi:hypothetical protein
LRFHVEEAGADAKLIQHGPLEVPYHRRHPKSSVPVARITAHTTVPGSKEFLNYKILDGLPGFARFSLSVSWSLCFSISLSLSLSLYLSFFISLSISLSLSLSLYLFRYLTIKYYLLLRGRIIPFWTWTFIIWIKQTRKV